MSFVQNPEKAAQLASAANEIYYPNVLNLDEATEFVPEKNPIYIYNISGLELMRCAPPNHPHIYIRPCPRELDYVLCYVLEHPFTQIEYDQNDNRYVRYTNGYKEATRIINPLNTGTDQWIPFHETLSENNNFAAFGVFWSVNNPPLPEELAKAKDNMEKSYKAELAQMSAIEQQDPQGSFARANKLSRAAAAYFGESRPWYRSDLIPKLEKGLVDCGACGEQIRSIAKICNSCGAPTNPQRLEVWLENKFNENRRSGRPRNIEE